MFKVIEIKKTLENISNFNTLHAVDRLQRKALYNQKKGQLLACFIVDKNHEKGLEIHALFEGAIVEVYNLQSGRFITTLALRLGQLKRLLQHAKTPEFINGNQVYELTKSAINNQNLGLNEIE
jgi:hypothetical protein